jgi:hypothetical protein
MKIKDVRKAKQQNILKILEIIRNRAISEDQLLRGYFESDDMYSCAHDPSNSNERTEYVFDGQSLTPRLEVSSWAIWSIQRDKVREDKYFRKRKKEEKVERRYAEAAQQKEGETAYEYYSRLLACCDIEKDVVRVTRRDGTSIAGVLQKFSSEGIQIGFFRYMSGMCGVVRLPVNGWCALDQISHISVGRNEMQGFFKRKEEEWVFSLRKGSDVNDV